MNDYKTGDYSSFNTAVNTVNSFNSEITSHIEKLTSCNKELSSGTIFMGPICDSCLAGFAKAMTALSTINTNNQSMTTAINQISNNYQSGDKLASDTVGNIDSSNYKQTLSSITTPTREQIIEKGKELGYSEEYIKTIIGTAQNEGYVDDPYLYYGWSSVMLNYDFSPETVYGWGGGTDYYSRSNILNGYEIASDDVLKSVYLSLTNRNTNIAECDGMYSSTPAGYSVLYDSPVYDCTVYERS